MVTSSETTIQGRSQLEIFSINQRNQKEYLVGYLRVCLYVSGDVYKEEVWSDEEGVRTERSLRLWNRSHHLQPFQQVVSVCEHWHGPSTAQVHRVQRAARESHKQRHNRSQYARLCYAHFDDDMFSRASSSCGLENPDAGYCGIQDILELIFLNIWHSRSINKMWIHLDLHRMWPWITCRHWPNYIGWCHSHWTPVWYKLLLAITRPNVIFLFFLRATW